MNYRMLFVISLITLVVGIGGILFMPTEDEGENEKPQPSLIQEQLEKKAEKMIVLAELKRDVSKSTLLQPEDYSLSQITVSEDNPLINNDLSEAVNSSQGLQGYLVAENLKAGSLLSKNMVISPNDHRFLLASLDAKQEVAYRIYVGADERYLFDTIHSGDYVSVYNQKAALDSRNVYEKTDLVKVSGKLLVLQTKQFQQHADQENTGSQSESGHKDYIGYVNVKINAEQAKKFYTLDKESKLIILPETHDEQNINHRGVFIRKLRGQ
ncbi:flp operon protein C [Pasteurella sp. PK-2025]|uniref:flp operon protein C n=1 Tax=Pasteurella sp. PK-2025 TaxID=3413133 RepID=UPI003C74AC90